MDNNSIILFENKSIRQVWHEGQWFFSVVDIIEILTSSVAPKKYWTKLKKRLKDEGFFEVTTESSLLKSLKMKATDGKFYLTDAAPRQTILRIAMSVKSPKAEPLRVWLAQVGNERFEEIENPEIAVERAREIYKAKGYPDDWIEMRLKSIDIRKQLTDEWKGRGVVEGQEYSLLTAEIAKATFGIAPSEHKTLKKLDKQNLRDHMTNVELIFTMLGEEAESRIIR
jgi:DNA-damage-inducible protein D